MGTNKYYKFYNHITLVCCVINFLMFLVAYAIHNKDMAVFHCLLFIYCVLVYIMRRNGSS